ncbi:MAG: penicillin acylase family protein, partial [Burkholderiaceae bacterium]|nr:penicillin acylase family protein [Burkholderiaceae bacterium]
MVKKRGSRSRIVTTLRWTGFLVGALVLLVVAVLAGYRAVTLPDRSGSVELAGLRAPVQVLRDRHGVAHIRAANEPDAFFALGHAHASDRLWQLEMNRRIVAGRLAEVLGPAALTTDRVLRVLGVRRQAAEVWKELDPPTREILEAYVAGINAGVEQANAKPWKLSPEFLILGVRPGKWEPVDAIGWATMMAWDLSANLNTELLRAALWPRLGTERLSWLLDTDPALALPDRDTVYADPVKLASGDQTNGNALAAAAAISGLLHATLQAAFPSAGNDGIGSNNWVIDASRSLTGGALLANDPHLALGAPALWYLAQLSAPGLEVIGATMPGLPYVVLGRTERTAWGFTNTSPDSEDLYLERLDPADASRYRTPDGWAPFETRSETIVVRGQPDVQLTVRSTRHGPVISDALPTAQQALTAAGQDAGYVLALRWTALEPGDRTIRAGLGINRASDWVGFETALRDFSAPQQN